MSINEELMGRAREIHDGFVHLGLDGHAAAIRVAVSIAVRDKEIEDELGQDGLNACLRALSGIQQELSRTASTKPITYGHLGDTLHRCLPHIKLLNETERVPSWMTDAINRTQENLSKLASTTVGANVNEPVADHIYVKMADGLAVFGRQVCGEASE